MRPTLVRLTNELNVINSRRLYSSTNEEAKKEEEKAVEESSDAGSKLTEEQKQLKDLQNQLEAKNKEVLDLKDRLLRSVAEFRNLQEVTKKDIKAAKDFALQKFAKDLLESVDNFGHALKAFKPEELEENEQLKELYTGVKMTRDVFEKTLKKYGIEKIEPIDEPFNPNLHEALFELQHDDKAPGTVLHVQQPGYTLNSRVIRPAKVGVVKHDAK